MANDVVGFYLEESTGPYGLGINAILHFDDALLEQGHNYIQWLFPLPDKSERVQNAPVLDDFQIKQFQDTPAIKAKMEESLSVMLAFYGLRLNDDATITIESKDKVEAWVTPRNHNFLRITRIIRSLRIVGLDGLARAVMNAALEVADLFPDIISETTRQFWTQAYEEPYKRG